MVQVMEVPAGVRVELERMARSSVLPHRQVVQAKALLALADGRSVCSTAKELGTYPNTVTAWRDRFLAAGVDGVGAIAPGRGRKPEIPAATIEVIVHDTLLTVPDDGSMCWSTRTLAELHGLGKDTVQRIWKARNLRPWQVDRFKLSNIRTSRPSSSMSRVCTWIRRSRRWCSPSMRRPSARPSIALNRRCR